MRRMSEATERTILFYMLVSEDAKKIVMIALKKIVQIIS